MKDWRTRLEEARQCGSFTMDDKVDAGSWKRCAISEVDARLPRDADGDPDDPVLYTCAIRFPGEVGVDNIEGAISVLNRIQCRELELLMQMGLTKPEVSDDVLEDRVKETIR